MQFIDIQTELTTAATDLLLAAVSFFSVYALYRRRGGFAVSQKAYVWSGAFAALGIAGLLGFFAHGFQMSEGLNNALWQPLYLSLGITVALFAAGVLIDLRRSRLPRWALILLIAAAVLFYGVTVLFPGSFLVFIAYEAVAMLFALAVYFYLGIQSRSRWAWFMTAGIALSIIAAVIQAVGGAVGGIGFTLIWEFDHNGIFHLVQIPGVLLLVAGLLGSIEGSSAEHASARSGA
jgi:hypothetical protein